jgi:hypothetical protein
MISDEYVHRERRKEDLKLSGHKAYPGASLDTMVSHGIGVNHGTAGFAEDGRRFGEITEAKRTPDKFDIRPSTKYRESHGIVLAVSRLRLRGAEISMKRDDGTDRERPDGLLRFQNGEVGIEAVRVAPSSHAQSIVIDMQAYVLKTVEADKGLAPTGMVVSFFLKAGAVTAMSKVERAAVLSEILELLNAKRFALMPPHHGLTSVFQAGSVAERFGMTVNIDGISGQTSGYGLQVQLELDAPSNAMTQPILDEIAKKLENVKKEGYDLSRPLWLVVEVAEPTGLFTDSIAAMPATLDIAPFEQIGVTDGHTHAVIKQNVLAATA